MGWFEKAGNQPNYDLPQPKTFVWNHLTLQMEEVLYQRGEIMKHKK